MSQFRTVQLPPKLPVVTNLKTALRQQRRNASAEISVELKAHLYNCFAELDAQTGEYSVEKRPGRSEAVFDPEDGQGAGRGIFAFNPTSYSGPTLAPVLAVVGDGVTANLYQLDANDNYSSTILGTVQNTGGMYRFTVVEAVEGEDTLVVFGNGIKAYFTDGATVTEILTADNFPERFYKSVAYLNSRLYVFHSPNKLMGATNLKDPVDWDLLNLILAQDEPDHGMALARHMNFIVALKESNVEFFLDQGNPTGSPLSVLAQNKLNIGCFSADTVQDIDGTLFWVSSNKQRRPQVVRMDNLRYTVISTPDVEKVLETVFEGPADVDTSFRSFHIKISGHRFYVLTVLTINFTLVYDIDQQLWYVWGEEITASRPFPIWGISDATTTSLGNTILQDFYTGEVYLCEADYVYPTDNGVPCIVDIYTPNFDAGSLRRKQLNMMFPVCDRVAGNSLKVRTNDHDYLPGKWTNFRTINLDDESPRLGNCGSFYRRAHHFRHHLACPFRMTSVGLQFDMGTL